MNEYDVHDLVKKHVCKEIEMIAEQMQKSGTMSEKDLERLDMLYHLKKDLLATHGMEHPEEYEGTSAQRGRTHTGTDGSNDYTDGYSRGYADAMRRIR